MKADSMDTKQSYGEGRKIRFGVIGAGWFASRRHIPDIIKHPRAELVALCRRDRAPLERLMAHFGVKNGYTDWREMLDTVDMDAVVIATPHSMHYEPARAALERNLHVLLEKPMTVVPSEAWKLVRLAHRKQRALAVALNPPYWAHCHFIRNAIRNNLIGKLESISIEWSGNADFVFSRAPMPENLPGVVPPTLFRGDPEMCGGGYLIDGGSHLISEVLWTTGRKPLAVNAQMDQFPSDRRSAVTIDLEDGLFAVITCIGDSAYPNRRVRNTFNGTSGVVAVDDFDFETTIHRPHVEDEVVTEAGLTPVEGPVCNLISAMLEGTEIYSMGEHGAWVAEVVSAAYRSASNGRTIRLHPPSATAMNGVRV